MKQNDVMSRELTLQLPNLRLAGRAWGDPTLPRLLALHGWLDNAASFDELAPLLCEKFHIVALDFPGHGRSDHRAPGAWYHHVDYPGDVLAAAQALEWSTFSLLGHSLGGTIACAVAAIAPERIEYLFLIDALGSLSAPDDQALRHLQKATLERVDIARKELRVFTSEAQAVTARQQASKLSSQASQTLVARGLKRVPGGFSWSSDSRLTLASPQRFTEPQVASILRGIRAHTLLILAQPEPAFLPRELVDARISQVTGITVSRLAGTHHLHLETPHPVAAKILEFAATTDAESTRTLSGLNQSREFSF